MTFHAAAGLPERLVELQEKMQAGDPLARKVYETIGTYLGYAVAHYADFYELKHISDPRPRDHRCRAATSSIERAQEVLRLGVPGNR